MVVNVPGGQPKLNEEKSAIGRFVQDPATARLYMGMVIHPPQDGGAGCGEGDYVPIVPVQQVGNGMAFSNALTAVTADGSSPWSGALAAGAKLALAEATAHADRNVALLFMADDTPTSCDTSIANMSVPLTQARGHVPPVLTHTIGLVASSADGTPVPFQQLADAGGGAAFMPTPPLADAILTNLINVRDLVACDLRVPPGASLSSMKISLDVGTPQTLSHVTDRAACAVGDGWFSATADTITLCPASCKAFLKSASAKVVGDACP
jgi:hypothetical protein